MKKVYLLIAALTALVLSAPISPKRKPPFLCLIGFHRYRTMHNNQGEHYLECTRCKKYKDDKLPGGPGR